MRVLKIAGIVFGVFAALVVIIIAGLYIWSESLGYKYEVENPIYPPGKTWSFKASFLSAASDTVKVDTIYLDTYDERFMIAQNKITWRLEKLNSKTVSTTGIIEKEDRIWMHPPRFDGYFEFTEYSAFPEIIHPIVLNDTWESKLMLGSFATEQTGSSLQVKYSVVDIDTIQADPLIRQTEIMGTGTSGLGDYTNLISYNDSLGITKMHYKNPMVSSW